jgi:hydroxymethylbilane synthase
MRLGSRRSPLALAQARLVADLLGRERTEIVEIATSGDGRSSATGDGTGAGGEGSATTAPRQADKSRWVDALEDALREGEIDLAVHSAKDVPGVLGEGLELLGAPVRAAVEDVLIGARSVAELAPGARVGTSSLRRIAQLLAAREDIVPVPVRGNVGTRLRKLAEHSDGIEALVLARSGLDRLGREAVVGGSLQADRFVPAPGQGTLALQGRVGDDAALAAARAVTDETALCCLLAERALARGLRADCDTPLGAWAQVDGDRLLLRAWVGLPDGSAWVADELEGSAAEPEALGARGAERVAVAGGAELLARAREMAGVDSL